MAQFRAAWDAPAGNVRNITPWPARALHCWLAAHYRIARPALVVDRPWRHGGVPLCVPGASPCRM